MLRKLFWTIILILTLYLLLMFKAPSISSAIDKLIWFPWLTEAVTRFKWTLDETYTNLPSKEEVKDTYNKVYSWAVEFKENFEEGVEITKDKIDSARVFLSWAEDTYNDAKETYEDAVEFIDDTSDKLEETRESIEDFVELTEELSDVLLIEDTETWTISE